MIYNYSILCIEFSFYTAFFSIAYYIFTLNIRILNIKIFFVLLV